MEHSEIISNMIDKIIQGDNVSAKEDYEALISSKLQAALDDKKVEVAQSIYGSDQPDDDTVSIEDTEEESEEDTEEAS